MAESKADDSAGAAEPAPQDELPAPDTLIADTIAALRNSEATDTALLDVLADHVLTMAPAATAVADAGAAIEVLAAKRAQESDDDSARHD